MRFGDGMGFVSIPEFLDFFTTPLQVRVARAATSAVRMSLDLLQMDADEEFMLENGEEEDEDEEGSQQDGKKRKGGKKSGGVEEDNTKVQYKTVISNVFAFF
jgi:hypothetical protein